MPAPTADPIEALFNFGIKQAIGYGIKQAVAPVISAVDSALFGAVPAAAPALALEGGGVAAGSGMFAAEATGLGFMDSAAFGGGAVAEAAGIGAGISGALAAFGPAGLALGVATLLSAINKRSQMRMVDAATVHFRDGQFVVTRDQTVGDDGTGKLADQVAARLNTYYAARSFDPDAYLANDPWRGQGPQNLDPGENRLVNEPVPGRIAALTRIIPDVRTPTIGYAFDVGWADEEFMIANADDLVLSTVRRTLLKAGESPESIDAFLGGPEKGKAGGLPQPHDLPHFDNEPGSPTPSPAAQELLVADAALRDQRGAFVPLAAYPGIGASGPSGPKPPYTPRPSPSVPGWREAWPYERDRPTERPAQISDDLWTAWEGASPAEQASAWRVIGVDAWRTLTGLPSTL